MGVAVLLLWLFTASAGVRVLFTSGLGRQRDTEAAAAAPSAVPEPEPALDAASPPSKREARRAARQRFDPPTLVRNRNEPVPGLKELVEFTHPALGITGLAFWLGYSLVHNRTMAWIAFGLAAATACAGLAWFTGNLRAGRGASFSARLLVVHGAGAAVTFGLAALTALTARG